MTQSRVRRDGEKEREGGGGGWGTDAGRFRGVGGKEMSKRYIVRSSQCLSTHNNHVGQRVFHKASKCCFRMLQR